MEKIGPVEELLQALCYILSGKVSEEESYKKGCGSFLAGLGVFVIIIFFIIVALSFMGV